MHGLSPDAAAKVPCSHSRFARSNCGKFLPPFASHPQVRLRLPLLRPSPSGSAPWRPLAIDPVPRLGLCEFQTFSAVRQAAPPMRHRRLLRRRPHIETVRGVRRSEPGCLGCAFRDDFLRVKTAVDFPFCYGFLRVRHTSAFPVHGAMGDMKI